MYINICKILIDVLSLSRLADQRLLSCLFFLVWRYFWPDTRFFFHSFTNSTRPWNDFGAIVRSWESTFHELNLGYSFSLGSMNKPLRVSSSWHWPTAGEVLQDWPTAQGVVSEKLGGGVRPASQNPLAYLWPKSAIFPTLLMTWPKIRNPIYYLNLTSKSCFRPAL